MQTNDVVELKIDRMSFGSAAVGRVSVAGEPRQMVIFVEGAVPGEKVTAKLRKNNKTYWEADLVEILEPSPDRATPPCPVFGRCGGCQWQHLSYQAQLRAKTEILIHQLNRATRLSEEMIRAQLTIHGAQNPLGYRSRIQVHGNGQGIGFFAAHSHQVVPTERCVVAHPEIQQVWSKFLRTSPLAELAKSTGQFKVEWTRTESGQVLEAINRKHGAYGFTQVNSEQNQVLTRLVSELAGTGQTLFDLYGGDGNLSNSLVDKFQFIFSVDAFNHGADPTTLQAPLAAERVFLKEKTEEFLLNQRWRDWKIGQIDCTIADPPRDGLRGVASRIADLNAPRVILVSCDPSTLARDLTAFTAASYRVNEIHLIDMFPHTYHMETVVLLTKPA